MIERKILHTKLRDYQVDELLAESLSKVGFSSSKLKKTPLGEKITILASRPGLVVGRKGSNIKNLTKILKNRFKLENPQIEIEEVTNQNLDAQIVAEKIQSSLERFGTKKFKGIGHKTIEDVMSAGALGIEILISGKIPSQRAKRWRFYKGYLKKSGDIATSKVATAYTAANLKSGTVGIQVRIMLPDTWLPDRIDILPKTDVAESVTKPTVEENTKIVDSEDVVEEGVEEGVSEEVDESNDNVEIVKESKKNEDTNTKKELSKGSKIETELTEEKSE